MISKLLIPFVAFLVGILIASLATIHWPEVILAIILALILLIIAKFKSESSLIKQTGFILLLLSLGLGRMVWSYPSAESLSLPLDETATLTGVVVAEPDERQDKTYLTFAPDGDYALVLISAPRAPVYDYGDRLEVVGRLVRPKNFSTDIGREFDYRHYLAKDGIYYQMFQPQIKRLSGGEGIWVKSKLYDLKHRYLTILGRLIPEPQAALMGGLTVGAKQGLGEDLLRDFRRTGVVHIIVLSGYNVTVVATSLVRLFSFLPHLVGLSTGGLAIVLFALMTGGGATVIRSSVMAIIALLAQATGHVYDVTRALILAAWLMLVHNPQVLVYDIGFQLSFLATLGLIYGSPLVEVYLGRVPERWGLRGIISSTLATQIFVLPWLLYQIGELSLVAMLTNFLILMLVPLTMLLGFITGSIGLISELLATPVGYLANLLLAYQIAVVKLLANLPLAAVNIKFFPWWLAAVCYSGYVYLFHVLSTKEAKVDTNC